MWAAEYLPIPRRRCSLPVALSLAAILSASTAADAQEAGVMLPNSFPDTAAPAQTPDAALTPGLPSPATDPGYRLGTGDVVRIVVFGQNDLSGSFPLDGQGMISMPLIKNIEAKGLTASELEHRIVKKLTPNYLKDPNVNVEILRYRPFYIVGEVRSPGSYSYVSGMTAINAVALAGGFTYRADEDDFDIKRGRDRKDGGVEIEADPETKIEPGDVITVNERWF